LPVLPAVPLPVLREVEPVLGGGSIYFIGFRNINGF
jgi:hypothetical protein